MGLTGNVISIWGAVFADRFYFERLALIYVGPQPPSSLRTGRSDMETGIREVAKLFRTLDGCIGDLIAHYTALQPAMALSRDHASTSQSRRSAPSTGVQHSNVSGIRFVHWTSFQLAGEVCNLVYGHRLTDYTNKTVFEAVMTVEGKQVEVIVKFAHRYGESGHRLLAKEDLAPTVYYCAFEETVGMWAIVMSKVTGDTSRALTAKQSKELQRAVGLLHAQELVFGDLRRPNVIAIGKDKISLIDYEWCGRGEVVRYPTDISTSLDWAPGVGPDKVITKEHDEYQLNKLCTR